MNNIYKMELHEGMIINTNTGYGVLHVIRVAGGWIYESLCDGKISASVFVPFNNEFAATEGL